jgi:hypothetical protein
VGPSIAWNCNRVATGERGVGVACSLSDEAGTLELLSPLEGWCTPLEDLPDPVFAGRMLGDGVAIDPTSPLVARRATAKSSRCPTRVTP